MKEFIEKLIARIVNSVGKEIALSFSTIGEWNAYRTGCAYKQNQIIDLINQLAEEYKEKPILKNYVDGQEIEPYGRPRVYMAIEDLNELKAYRDLGTLHQIRVVIDRYQELNDSYHQLIKEEHNNGWIPCSERLPEENVNVLIQINFKDDIKIAVSSRIDFNYWTCFGRDVNVIAWQPLPAPYKGEQK